jgi:hypothetical protein
VHRRGRLSIGVQCTDSVQCTTATTPKADAEQNDPLFDRILSSVRFASNEEAREV